MRNNKPTHLYILSCNDQLKIGVTNNIQRRIKQLQTGNPIPIILEYIDERSNPIKAERYLHSQLSQFRVQGEWFTNITVNDIRVKLMLFLDQE